MAMSIKSVLNVNWPSGVSGLVLINVAVSMNLSLTAIVTSSRFSFISMMSTSNGLLFLLNL